MNCESVADFEARGGNINIIPFGESGLDWSTGMPKQKVEHLRKSAIIATKKSNHQGRPRKIQKNKYELKNSLAY